MPLTTYQSGDVLTASSLNANLVFAASAPTSRVFLVTQNGYGSSSTAIPRFTTAVVNSGSDITYADSASLGTTFTINTTGMYAMSMWINMQISNDLDIAFSLNSTQLTTRPLSLTASTRLAMSFLAGSATEAQIITCGTSFFFTAGDVIRPVATPARTPFDTSRCGVMIARMS